MSESSLLGNIIAAQIQYATLVLSFERSLGGKRPSREEIGYFIDDLKRFWFPRRAIINHELELATARERCLILLGATYLNVAEEEHFYFAAFGDRHFLPDPFLKMEYLLRAPSDKSNVKETISFFCRVLADTVRILKDMPGLFLFIPLHDLNVESENEHHERLKDFFEKFLLSMMKTGLESVTEFLSKYTSYEEIESDLLPAARTYLVFSESVDPRSSLREKITEYIQSQFSFAEMTRGLPEQQVFKTTLYSWVSQAFDVLLQALYHRLTPYVRFSVTFSYLYLILENSKTRPEMTILFDHVLVFFFFRRSVPSPQSVFPKIDEFIAKSTRVGFNHLPEKLREEMGPLSEVDIPTLKARILLEYERLIDGATTF